MSIMYEPVCTAIGDSGINRGLEEVLIEIGKNEFEIKRNRAICEHKNTFLFPSGKFSKRNKVLCRVDSDNLICNDLYKKEGIFRINKMAGYGQFNKTTINCLIYSNIETRYDGNNLQGRYHVFYLNRIKAAPVFAAIHRYIRRRYTLHNKSMLLAKERQLLIMVKNRVFIDGSGLKNWRGDYRYPISQQSSETTAQFCWESTDC